MEATAQQMSLAGRVVLASTSLPTTAQDGQVGQIRGNVRVNEDHWSSMRVAVYGLATATRPLGNRNGAAILTAKASGAVSQARAVRSVYLTTPSEAATVVTL